MVWGGVHYAGKTNLTIMLNLGIKRSVSFYIMPVEGAGH